MLAADHGCRRTNMQILGSQSAQPNCGDAEAWGGNSPDPHQAAGGVHLFVRIQERRIGYSHRQGG